MELRPVRVWTFTPTPTPTPPMRNALITASYGTLAAGVLCVFAAVLPPFGTNPRMAEQLTAGLMICHAAAIPALAASRCEE